MCFKVDIYIKYFVWLSCMYVLMNNTKCYL